MQPTAWQVKQDTTKIKIKGRKTFIPREEKAHPANAPAAPAAVFTRVA